MKHPSKFHLRDTRWVSITALALGLGVVAFSGGAPVAAAEPAHATAAAERVERLVSSLSDEEVVGLLSGTGFATKAVPRLGIPAFLMSDGPAGLRSFSPSTAYAAGIGLAASWDVGLAEEVGVQLGRDSRARGVQFLLGPGANQYRAPMNGRNFEYFGEDPLLGSGITVGYIKGVQSQNVSATVKHFVGNDSEFARRTSDSIIDERALREIYLPVFEAAVKEAHVGAVMCAYNLTNGAYMSENPRLNNEVLKQQWGFDGLLMSDWGAVASAVGAANGGLDLEMPDGKFMNPASLLPALKDERVTRATLDDKVRRLFRIGERFGWFESVAPDVSIGRYNQAGRATALKGALEGAVLLKNTGDLLPLDARRLKTVAVIGPLAQPGATTGGGSGRVSSFNPVSLLQGLNDSVGPHTVVTYAPGIRSLQAMAMNTVFSTAREKGRPGLTVEEFKDPSFKGPVLATRTEWTLAKLGGPGFGDADLGQSLDQLPPERRKAVIATLRGSGERRFERWTGWYTPTQAGNHTLFVQNTGAYRVLVDDKVVLDNVDPPRGITAEVSLSLDPHPHRVVFEQKSYPDYGRPAFRLGILRPEEVVDAAARQLASTADVVVLAVGFGPDVETEGSDRSFGLPPGQDQLIQEIAQANPRTVVVVTSGGSVDTRPWLDKVPALIAAWYPGQESGTALARLLLGQANPSGRLPISWERRIEDNPSYASYYYNEPQKPAHVVYREGLFVGYRGYQQSGTKPLFPFGFGLSYTTFKYSNVQVVPATPRGLPVAGSRRALYSVSFEITNTGKRAGADVAQLYVAPIASRVPRPKRELKAFARVELAPGETRKLSLPLDARAFAYYDVENARWQADAGRYSVEVARSVDDVQALSEVTLPAPLTVGVGE